MPDCDVMEKFLKGMREDFNVSPDAEITIEANPGTLTPEKLQLYRKYGINRISIGLQSPKDKELKILGRIHNYSQFLESYHMAREAGFSQYKYRFDVCHSRTDLQRMAGRDLAHCGRAGTRTYFCVQSDH